MTDLPLRRNRDFGRLWTAQAAVAFGGAMAGIVYPLLALSVTGSAGLAGVVSLLGLGAVTLVRLPAGVLIDRWPLKRILIITDLVRAGATAVVALALVLGRLDVVVLGGAALLSGACAGFSDTAQSVAVRHVVPAAQLPRAFALNDGRGHAVALVGNPSGGFLYGLAAVVPVVGGLLAYLISAVLTAAIRHPLRDLSTHEQPAAIRRELITGLRFIGTEPFLRSTLLCAAGFQFVFAGVPLAMITTLTRTGATGFSIGLTFSVAAVGGLLGALSAPVLQQRLPPPVVVIGMGWVTAGCLAGLAWHDRPLVMGAILGVVYFVAAPANALLLATQITRTPARLQGRVIAAALLIAGLAAPLGAPTAGVLMDRIGPTGTFVSASLAVAVITVIMHLTRSIRTMTR